MERLYIDCREFPSDMKCTVAIAADSERELVDAAVQHAVAVHGHHDTPEFRSEIRKAIRKGSPPASVAA
jgi:predicted small metal-binding protein